MGRRRRPQWEPVPEGEIWSLSKRLRGRRQRRLFLRAGGALLGTLATGGLLVWWLRGPSAVPAPSPGPRPPADFFYGGIACSEVRAKAEAYGTGTLDAGIRSKIIEHLAKCPPCAAFYKAKGYAARTPHPGEPDSRHS
jgi:hypothetical protein